MSKNGLAKKATFLLFNIKKAFPSGKASSRKLTNPLKIKSPIRETRIGERRLSNPRYTRSADAARSSEIIMNALRAINSNEYLNE